MEKRYLLFIFDWYYPQGGFGDYIGKYATIEEAKNYWLSIVTECNSENCQIVDYETLQIVYKDSISNMYGRIKEEFKKIIEKNYYKNKE